MSRRRRGEIDLSGAVVEFLDANPARGFKVKELQRALGVPHSRYRALRQTVVELARAGRIGVLPRRRYGALAAALALEGRLEGVGERATHVRLADGSRLPLTVDAQEAGAAGDRVRIRKIRDGREHLARIDRILEAAPRTILGVLENVGSHWVLEPEAPVPGLRGGCFLDEAAAAELTPDDEGAIAQGSLPAFDPAVERPRVTDVTVLGAEDHPAVAMRLRVLRSGWPRAFGDAALADAAAGPLEEEPRRDLTELDLFTIDPIDARDHDDAVSIEAVDGGFVLGVHIADVAAYVSEGTALDLEARERATSVYPPGTVIPMLPETLSAGACSVHHGVERHALSVLLHYHADGRRRGVELGLSRIRSRASLAYEHAEAMLDDPDFRPPDDRLDDAVAPKELATSLNHMFLLANALRQRRRELGSLFVQRPEREFRFDDDGHVADVHLRPSLRAHWIIEEFMLEANRAVAEVLRTADLPLLWRIHEPPDERKVDDLAAMLKQFGINWVPSDPVEGHDYAELFAMLEGRDEAPIFHLMALRSLMKARYHAGWDRHFGLAFEQYTHFTSPIRRYPDLHNQRWLHRLIASGGHGGWLADALDVARQLGVARLARPADRAEAEGLADHCSAMEREAQRIERDCADICAADALADREGEDFDGMIVTVLGSGVFVELDGTGLDGFVGVERLGNDWFELDERRQALVGTRTGRRFRLGQRVRVLLEYVDVANGRIWLGDLRAAPDPSGAEPRHARRSRPRRGR